MPTPTRSCPGPGRLVEWRTVLGSCLDPAVLVFLHTDMRQTECSKHQGRGRLSPGPQLVNTTKLLSCKLMRCYVIEMRRRLPPREGSVISSVSAESSSSAACACTCPVCGNGAVKRRSREEIWGSRRPCHGHGSDQGNAMQRNAAHRCARLFRALVVISKHTRDM